ncbi:MAG: hypothetical protein WKG07_41845 [Hymenobacter sp.]
MAEVAHGRVAEAVADALRRHQPALVVLGHRNTAAMPDELGIERRAGHLAHRPAAHAGGAHPHPPHHPAPPAAGS